MTARDFINQRGGKTEIFKIHNGSVLLQPVTFHNHNFMRTLYKVGAALSKTL